jgi:hypothetical protein
MTFFAFVLLYAFLISLATKATWRSKWHWTQKAVLSFLILLVPPGLLWLVALSSPGLGWGFGLMSITLLIASFFGGFLGWVKYSVRRWQAP